MGVFIPGATLISIGGFLASTHVLITWDIIIYATLGAILGDFFSYSLGRWGGKWMKEKKFINLTLLTHGEKFFNKYGNISIFWGRFFGPIRAIIPFIAGISKMKTRPFIFWNILSGIGWATLNVFLGYFSGAIFMKFFNKWSGRITLILILIFVIYIIYRITKKEKKPINLSFKTASKKFTYYLNSKVWFNKLSVKYTFIPIFFKETKRAEEKLFGGIIAFILLIVIYILILILDVF